MNRITYPIRTVTYHGSNLRSSTRARLRLATGRPATLLKCAVHERAAHDRESRTSNLK